MTVHKYGRVWELMVLGQTETVRGIGGVIYLKEGSDDSAQTWKGYGSGIRVQDSCTCGVWGVGCGVWLETYIWKRTAMTVHKASNRSCWKVLPGRHPMASRILQIINH